MRLFAGTPFDVPPRCDRCGELEEACNCPPEAAPRLPPSKQTAQLNLEKRKRGKMVTVIRGLSTADNDLSALLTDLKTRCGAGGSVKEDHLEIQGDHLTTVDQTLSGLGYRVRRKG
ncbi:MAG: translation initiation factor [Pirellulaceae bacterium]